MSVDRFYPMNKGSGDKFLDALNQPNGTTEYWVDPAPSDAAGTYIGDGKYQFTADITLVGTGVIPGMVNGRTIDWSFEIESITAGQVGIGEATTKWGTFNSVGVHSGQSVTASDGGGGIAFNIISFIGDNFRGVVKNISFSETPPHVSTDADILPSESESGGGWNHVP